MKHFLNTLPTTAALIIAIGASTSAFALKPGCDAPPCGQGGGNQPPSGESAPNNLSYPVIFSDDARTPDWDTSVTSDPTTWLFAPFPDVIPNINACLQETGVPVGTEVPDTTSTLIPGTSLLFGSTSPPSAAFREAVFTGLDDEANPSLGASILRRSCPHRTEDSHR